MSPEYTHAADTLVRAMGLRKLAEDLGVSVGFLRLEIIRGRLLPTRLGRRVVVTLDEARRYLAENTRTAS